jgi:ribonucleoside-diphosphate reductase alpha chain
MTGDQLRHQRRDGPRARPFPATQKNREPCCASSATTAAPPTTPPASELRRAHHRPVGIDPPSICPADLLQAAARKAWDRALALGEKHGYRNAQVDGHRPTGTIGLVMDCDTTGIEPDFALVKFKKLAGGGYFKIINQSVARRCASSATARRRSTTSSPTAAARHLVGAPAHQPRVLRPRASPRRSSPRREAELPRRLRHRFAFNKYTLGDEFCKKHLGSPTRQLNDAELRPARALGFTHRRSARPTTPSAARMTIEGAPHLKDEHLPVFDCANKCGRTASASSRPRATSA